MEPVIEERIQSKIYIIRDQKVMIDRDLAYLYQVETKALNQAVKRNKKRFPSDFMFQLNDKEFENLRSQNVTANFSKIRSNPYAFTEHGIAMLSSILKSDIAIEVNIEIMRTFTKMRQFALNYEELVKRLHKNEQETQENRELIIKAFEYLEQILNDTKQTDEKLIGFRP
jgi:hypothetical protein